MSPSRRSWDHQVPGMITGLIAPVIGMGVFYFVQSIEMGGLSVSDYTKMLAEPRILSMILSWSLLANLAVFAVFNRIEYLRAAQGVVFATILYAVIIIWLKLTV